MQVEKNKVVEIDFTLKNSSGQVMDSSEGREPLFYIQGIGNLVPGVENALEGKNSGERVLVTVPPEAGYGMRNESLVLSVNRDKFAEIEGLKEGLRFQMDTPSGSMVFAVVQVGDEEVVVDGNHPLAGMTLDFDIKIQSVRDATSEELEHGHVHS